MLAVIIILSMIAFLYFVGYKLYGTFIDKNIAQPDDNNPVPSITQRDDVDFYPAPEPVLFGHHFSSIAGAGPIIGPIVAIMHFGWLAALGWIALGSIFIGAVHDYLSLIISVRNKGASVAEVAETAVGKPARNTMSAFIWITLVLIVAVFGVAAAKTLVAEPEMVIPTFGLIFVAIIFGQAVYKYKFSLVWGTVIAIAVNVGFILLGANFPIALPNPILGLTPTSFWFIVIIIYCCIASLLPVQILLQPRDYISTYNLYTCLILGIGAILVVRPAMNAPAFISFTSSKGPLYPMLFILIACGAVSGFHSLVAGGTTSKQIEKESHGKPVAFGGMLVEGILATMTLIMVGAGLYWVAPAIGNVDMSELGIHEVFKQGGWIFVFGNGFGHLVHRMLPMIPMTITAMIAMIALNTFILTTADTATRISRFIVQESLGSIGKAFKNKFIATAICIVPIFLIGYTNSYTVVWPVFGAANQLIASLTLFVISAYLLGKKKPTIYTVIPGIFMLITTISALCWEGYHFFYPLKGAKSNIILGFICIGLIFLALFVAYEAWKVFSEKGKQNKKGLPL